MEKYLNTLNSEVDDTFFKEAQINNYIVSNVKGFEAKSELLNNLYHQGEIDQNLAFSAIGDFQVNHEAFKIMMVKDIKEIALKFCIYIKANKVLLDTSFNFFGLTFKTFLPKDKKHPNREAVALSKMQDFKIVSNMLFKVLKQQMELQEIKRGNVSSYMSDRVFKIMTESKIAADEYLSNQYIELDDNQELTLKELQELSKKNKINELMMIKNYINELTSDGSWACRFITLTNRPEHLPRSFNANDKTHWDKKTTPTDNAKELQKGWRNIQSRANRNDIPLIGLWCREPHKNGGIHQHILVLTKKEFLVNDSVVKNMTKNQSKSMLGLYKKTKKEIIESKKLTLEKMFLQTFGYTNRSCKIDVLTSNKKSNNVINYITKYIMKTVNVSSYNGTTLDNEQVELDKVSFHRSLWNYRAYGIFGFKNNLGLWRFLRKISNQQDLLTSKIHEDSNLQKAIDMVKSNDYSSFVVFATNHFEKCFRYSKVENKHGEITNVKSSIFDGDETYTFNLNAQLNDILNVDGFIEIDESYLNFKKYKIIKK
ncbi:hypothetical protein C9J48_20410 [Photobacterium profundum]|uniref:Replication gene A protein-like domain-containing protein n=1 Tax=Photobacterium profundum 3TCK TaxID=314280 RepID=Q1Z4Y7_9GAMM|nr:replication endonuclease [Photobacterium profundum]EAS43484.1 hypothetical protein P3TCK_01469 [Photobacterium profundum 3TCK]PSV60262.1 hypothetical protein C9J48_20410 [Photobacterium profundum]